MAQTHVDDSSGLVCICPIPPVPQFLGGGVFLLDTHCSCRYKESREHSPGDSGPYRGSERASKVPPYTTHSDEGHDEYVRFVPANRRDLMVERPTEGLVAGRVKSKQLGRPKDAHGTLRLIGRAGDMQALRATTFSTVFTISIIVVSWSILYHFICSHYLV